MTLKFFLKLIISLCVCVRIYVNKCVWVWMCVYWVWGYVWFMCVSVSMCEGECVYVLGVCMDKCEDECEWKGVCEWGCMWLCVKVYVSVRVSACVNACVFVLTESRVESPAQHFHSTPWRQGVSLNLNSLFLLRELSSNLLGSTCLCSWPSVQELQARLTFYMGAWGLASVPSAYALSTPHHWTIFPDHLWASDPWASISQMAGTQTCSTMPRFMKCEELSPELHECWMRTLSTELHRPVSGCSKCIAVNNSEKGSRWS